MFTLWNVCYKFGEMVSLGTGESPPDMFIPNLLNNLKTTYKLLTQHHISIIDISWTFSLGGFCCVGVPAWDFPDCHTPGPSWLRHGGSVCQIQSKTHLQYKLRNWAILKKYLFLIAVLEIFFFIFKLKFDK